MQVLISWPTPLESNEILMVWAAVLLSSLLRSFTGFGFILIAGPILLIILQPIQVVVLSSALCLGMGLLSLRTYWDVHCVKQVGSLWGMSILGTLLGSFLLTDLSLKDYQLGIGFLLVITCLMLAFYTPSKNRSGPLVTASAGFFSGLLNGAFAAPGPPIFLYALGTESDPKRSRSLMLSFFTLSCLSALIIFGAKGLVGLDSLWLFLMTFPGMVLGDKAGYFLFKRFAATSYRKIALLALGGSGLITIMRALQF